MNNLNNINFLNQFIIYSLFNNIISYHQEYFFKFSISNLSTFDFKLQPFTKYLRQTSCEIAKYRKVLTSIFQQLFASINKSFILGGGLGTRL